MAEIDLVPLDYRRALRLGHWLRRFAWIYGSVVLVLVMAQVALSMGVRERREAVAALDVALALEGQQQQQIDALSAQKRAALQRQQVLETLRGGIAAVDMFALMDRASAGDVWFTDWHFRRAGEVVDAEPQGVRAGYFVVLPPEKEGDLRERGWLMETHMELTGRALDHESLAGFTRRLVEQPEIAEAHVLSTRTQQRGGVQLVEFELAVVVETRG